MRLRRVICKSRALIAPMVGDASLCAVVACAVLVLGVAILAAQPVAADTDADDTPVWQRDSYISRGWDRSFKCDLVEEQPEPPQVVVYGGSRGLRMDPATITRATGLRAFNAAFHNGRPEDAWAFTDWLIDRSPDTTPFVIWCLQATNLQDVQMAPGLIVDERLSQAFPPELIEAKMPWAMRQGKHDLLGGRRYGPDGMLWWNIYDQRRKDGLGLDRALTNYLDADMLAKAGNGRIPNDTRAMKYFRATIKKLNSRGVKPLIVIMPYHPRVLRAFLAVGWGVKEQWFTRYLTWLQAHTSLKFQVLDCLSVSTFGGGGGGFYDGAHLTAGNSRRLIRYALKKAPGCFKIHKSWILPAPEPAPTPNPTATPEPTTPPAVQPPAYEPVPESTTPGDQLE